VGSRLRPLQLLAFDPVCDFGRHLLQDPAAELAQPVGLELAGEADQRAFRGRDGLVADLGRQVIEGVGDGRGLAYVHLSGAQGIVQRRPAIQRRSRHDPFAGRARIDAQPGSEPAGGGSETLGGRDAAGLDLSHQMQRDRGRGLLVAVCGPNRVDQLGIGERPGPGRGEFHRVRGQLLEGFSHVSSIEHTYDSFGVERGAAAGVTGVA